jgi:TonB family protein
VIVKKWLVGLLTAMLSQAAAAADPPPAPAPNVIHDVTDKPPQPPPPPGDCKTRIKLAANPDNYYPAAAKAEERQGAPIVRVTVKRDQAAPDSIVLVTSSNHADLDEAAIQVAKASTYVTTCEVGTVTFKVKFFFTEQTAT